MLSSLELQVSLKRAAGWGHGGGALEPVDNLVRVCHYSDGMNRRPRPIGETSLARWRALDATSALQAIAQHAKKDISFAAVKDPSSSRWHATVDGVEYELILTGPRFWDCRASVGGGGAIDLVMYLAHVDFRAAARKLRAAGL